MILRASVLDTTYCDGKLLKRMLVAGGRWLSLHRGILNELNVFPVPDGDTGTNLSLTMRGALTPLLAREAPGEVNEVASLAARGALLGARGNSGVILSQILHGFASAMEGLDKASTVDMTRAFTYAKEYAYKAVQQPREGTILTVLRIVSERAPEISARVSSLPDYFRALTACAKDALVDYRDELPALKQAGVVDAGGLGLIYVFEGMLKVTEGKQLTIPHNDKQNTFTLNLPDQHSLESAINYGYCTEFLVEGTSLTPEEITPQLNKLGDSIVVAKTKDILKVHIHTNTPDLVELLVTPGSTSFRRKVEDMREQNQRRREDYQRGISPAQQQATTAEFRGELQLIEAPSPAAVTARNLPPLVAICTGEGFTGYFSAWQAHIVHGGQTTNPSTAEILQAITEAHNATPDREVLVFPNNSNCVAAAEQACALCGVPARVIPTRCPSQLAAFLNSDVAPSALELGQLLTGEITQAVKDAVIDNQVIHTNDFLVMWKGQLVAVATTFSQATVALLEHSPKKMVTRLLIAAGKDCDPDELEQSLARTVEALPATQIEFIWGGQPHHLILATME